MGNWKCWTCGARGKTAESAARHSNRQNKTVRYGLAYCGIVNIRYADDAMRGGPLLRRGHA